MKRVISGEYVIETDYDEEDESGDDWEEDEEDGDDDWDEDDEDEEDDDWDEDEDEEEDDDDDVWWRSKSKIDSGEFTFYDDGDDMYDYDGEFLDY